MILELLTKATTNKWPKRDYTRFYKSDIGMLISACDFNGMEWVGDNPTPSASCVFQSVSFKGVLS